MGRPKGQGDMRRNGRGRGRTATPAAGGLGWLAATASLAVVSVASAQEQVGSIRGLVTDGDFDAPMPAARVTINELQLAVESSDQGNFVFPQVPPGSYTVVFSKPGYARVVRTVVVGPGQLLDLDVEMSGDFTEMEEFVVQDVLVGGTEAALLDLRLDSPALLDSISSDLLSRAGAGDAAAALNLVAGATVQDGKFAVIRGLPDRFVVSQLNGIRLPTADEEKRAVQLDQFPSDVIESVQVSKTFTPDQQGDASGGAVNVVLKGIPEETKIGFGFSMGYNSQTSERSDFLTYAGGGVGLFGDDDGGRDPQGEREVWEGAIGTQRGEAPVDFDWNVSVGGGYEFDGGLKIGAFGTFYYERDSDYRENARDDSYWVVEPGEDPVPQADGEENDFTTSLFDIDRGSQSVQWGGLGVVGVEVEGHSVQLGYLFTRIAEDVATLAEDTRGKEYFFPGYDPDDILSEGNLLANRDIAPYLRTQTLEYTERTTETVFLTGRHELPIDEWGLEDDWVFKAPIIDWTVSRSTARLYQPDKRQFGSEWRAPWLSPGLPPFIPPSEQPSEYSELKPAELFSLGNVQRIYKDIEERSEQYALNVEIPFENWTGTEGSIKFGVFSDDVVRTYDQDTYSNFRELGDPLNIEFGLGFDEFWSDILEPLISDGRNVAQIDVDYRGDQEIGAWYLMGELPITEWFRLIGGARWEDTRIAIQNFPEEDATWFPPEATAPVSLNPGDADVDFRQSDILPAISFVATAAPNLVIRGGYTETVARQTFRELTPIQQSEFLGADVFIGNPDLRMAALENYDLRADWTPTPGSLFSVSYFYKDIEDTIENVQRIARFSFTTVENYPEGTLEGWEFEARQDLGRLWEPLRGLTIGANATIIDSEVTLPDDEAAAFLSPLVMAPQFTRDMTNAPEYLYNLYFTYDIEQTGTQLSLFYTHRGDALIAGATVDTANLIPDVYETDFGTLNFTLSQSIGPYVRLKFSAKNLTNPDIETVYRSQYIGSDVVKTSYTKGIDYSIGISASIPF